MPDDKDHFDAGMEVRRDMFGRGRLGRTGQDRRRDPLHRPLPGHADPLLLRRGLEPRELLDRRTRSMRTISMLIALSNPNQLAGHIRGAIANGVTKEEIQEVLLHVMIYVAACRRRRRQFQTRRRSAEGHGARIVMRVGFIGIGNMGWPMAGHI